MDLPTLEEAALVASGAALVKLVEWLQAIVGRKTRRRDQKEEADASRASALWESFRSALALVGDLAKSPNPKIVGQSLLLDGSRRMLLSTVAEAMKSIHQIRQKGPRERLIDLFEILRWEGNTVRSRFGGYATSTELRAEAEAVLGALMRHEKPEPRSERFSEMVESHRKMVATLDQGAEAYEQGEIAARKLAAAQKTQEASADLPTAQAESGDSPAGEPGVSDEGSGA